MQFSAQEIFLGWSLKNFNNNNNNNNNNSNNNNKLEYIDILKKKNTRKYIKFKIFIL